MRSGRYESWGRFPAATHRVVPVHWRGDDPFTAAGGAPALPFGLGRSYGDSCLNDGGVLLDARPLDRLLALDAEAATLHCEAGVTLGEILDVLVPRGLFLQVVPGTMNVTVGGAIANDVHGKNHHRCGTFGTHVLELELLRSDGRRLVCSRTVNPELFAATVGGLGLTGLILGAKLSLRRLAHGAAVRSDTVALRSLDDYFARSEEADAGSEFCVAWIDCLAKGADIGRGLLYSGNWADQGAPPAWRGRRRRLAVPFELPFSPLNRVTLALFNTLYYARHRRAGPARTSDFEPFFFPLDGLERWNLIYGPKGFLQFQCALPRAAAPEALRELLGAISAAGVGSFLAVLKNFGAVPSPGLLSFPRPGVTLAVDIPNRGPATPALVRRLYDTVAAAGGRLYPAKDACMSAAQFQRQYAAELPGFRAQLDPACSSSFWRRVSA